jgi:hypothetical protein
MKRLLLILLVIVLSVPLLSGAPARAQSGQVVQIWRVSDIPDSPMTLEYRDTAGNVLASYVMGVDSLNWPAHAGGRIFGSGAGSIPVFDPYQGKVIYHPVPGVGVDTDQLFYRVSRAIPSPDGQRYAYGVNLQHSDPALAATSWVYIATLGQFDDRVIFQQDTESFLAIEPFGWSADGSKVLLHDMPQGIGGYILFWTYQNVQALDLNTGTAQFLGNIDGYSADLQYTALVERNDSGVTGLLVTQTATGAQTRYLLPALAPGEVPWAGGEARFSPMNTRLAYQIARSDPEGEKFWTIAVDLTTGESRVVLEDEAPDYDVNYGNLSGWLDENRLLIGSSWTDKSALVDGSTGQFIGEYRGSYVGTFTLAGTLAPSSLALAQCPGAPPSRLQPYKGGRITFTDGSATNVRRLPGVSAEVITQKPEGETFQVVGGPACADGFAWWQVNFPDNTYGYVAEGTLTEYYLEPW